MIKETNFYHISSINSDFDMQKVKLRLSDFTEIEDTLEGVLGYDVLHIKNIYNNRLFIEEINKEVNVNIESLVVSTGYIMTCCVVKAEIKDLNNTDFFKSFISKKREFKDSELKSFDSFATNLFNEKLLNLKKLFSKIIKNKLDDEDDNSINAKRIRFKKIVEELSCVKIIGKHSFLFTQGWGDASYKICSTDEGSISDYKLVGNINSDTFKVSKELKIYIGNNDIRYYQGDSIDFNWLYCNKELAEKKIREIITMCKGYMQQCSGLSSKILDRLSTNNPIFWKNISEDVECIQLMYIQTQAWISQIKHNIEKEDKLNMVFSDDYYKKFKKELNQKLSIISSLESQVDAALSNIATPIKARNDFKLQESTESGNDRILFLSFIAMSIPLISYIVSDTLSQSTKLISGIVIGTLPLLYFIVNKWYKKRMYNSYQKDNFELQLSFLREGIDLMTKQIKTIKQNQEKTETDDSGNIEFGQDFHDTFKAALVTMKSKEKKLKEKLKKYKRYKFE